MQRLLEELRRKQDSILFIDEIHTIAGAGSTQGSLDTANILKPALARGELQVIGPRRWTNIAKISRAIPRWNAAFRKSSSNPLRKRKPCKSCTTSHPITNGTTGATRTSIAGLRRPDRALHYRPQLSGQGDRRAGRNRGTYSPAGQRQNRKPSRKTASREPVGAAAGAKTPKTAPAKRRQRTRRLSVAPYGLFRPIPARPKSGPSISSRLLPP